MDKKRYSKQILFSGIGEDGQELIQRGSVIIIGCGALGSNIANNLTRAGVGRIKIVDRDFVELDNLQRQSLFDENDAKEKRPKVIAAAEKLAKVNSNIQIEYDVIDINYKNIETLVDGFVIILDGTDNIETRFLINDVSVKREIPWIYGGAIGSYGMSMNIIPGKTPCLRCFIEQKPPAGSLPTCDMIGVLNSVPAIIAAIQTTEALKILMGEIGKSNELIYVDIWDKSFESIRIERKKDCPVCVHKKFDHLSGKFQSDTFSLCGRNAVQISPMEKTNIDLKKLERKLAKTGEVFFNGFLLNFKIEGYELIIFPTGRTMVKGTIEESVARSLYAKYVGA